MKKITLLSLLAIVGIFGASQIVLADSSILSVSPASLNSTVGTAFNVSVQLNSASNKVCVVKGTLSLGNLSCQSITVASGLYAITTPTCANPSFMLGIPHCTTTAQSILSVSVKGTKAGQGSLSLSGVKVIGAGTDIAFSSQGGTYNIAAVPTTTPKPTPIPVTPTPTPTPTTPITENVTPETQPTQPAIAENISTPSFLATVFNFSTFGKGIRTIIIIVIIAFVIYSLVMLLKKKKKNQNIPSNKSI